MERCIDITFGKVIKGYESTNFGKNIHIDKIQFDFSGLYIVLKVFVIVFQRQEWLIIHVFCVVRVLFCLMYESIYLLTHELLAQ